MPSWLKNAVFYEIYPQSFYDTNADGIGDISGIIKKLGYIKELGCNAIWLNPCYESPFFDAGYDIADYRKIASRYGTNEDARKLFEEAHKLNMHVLLDLVPAHTSSEHSWFQQSKADAEGQYAKRYIWADGNPDERFENVPGIKGYINGIGDRGACAANYYSTQPALNYGFARVDPEKPWQIPVDAPEAIATKEAMFDVMRFWLDMGCDGFRVDMAASMIKNDEEKEETIKLWQEFRKMLDCEYPNAAMVSEWGNPKQALAAGFHMDFLLHFGPTKYLELFRENPFFSCDSAGDIAAFVDDYLASMAETKGLGYICLPSSNHDMPRISHRLKDRDLRLAFAFILTMPGVPFIYYGDEIGMRYLEGIPSVEGGYSRTGSRSPMQWDSTLNAGFSSACPEDLYIGIDPAPNRNTVAGQMMDEGSLWHTVQDLIRLRLENEALQSDGEIEFLHVEKQACPLVYRRGMVDGAILVALNPSNETARIALDEGSPAEVLYKIGEGGRQYNGELVVPPASGVLFKAGRR